MTLRDTRANGPEKKNRPGVAAPGRSGTQPEGRTHRMSQTTSTTTPKPLVVAPVATPKALNYLRSDGPVDIYGYCAPWCFYPIELSGVSHGNPVAEHGLWCHRAVGLAEAHTPAGSRAYCEVGMARPYMHGTYEASAAAAHRANYVELLLYADEEQCPIFLTVGEARRMIALLQRAADELDGLHKPLSVQEVDR